MNEKAKTFEEVQVSDLAIWRWDREGDLYVSRMTQESMDRFKRDVEQGRLDEREACAKLLDDFAKTEMVPAKDTWRVGVMAAANAVRDKK
jgi:hypothetical protein